MIAELAADVKREAETANERRVVVLAGDRDRGVDAAYDVIEAVEDDVPASADGASASVDDVPSSADGAAVSVVSTQEGFRFEEHRPRETDELLGRTREVVVLDCHEQFVPNALGRCVGAVDGGGLLVLLTPDLDAWPERRDRFDESLAVPPYDIDDVTGRFRERFVGTLRSHPGIAIASLGDTPAEDTLERDGLTGDPDEPDDPALREPTATPNAPQTATRTATSNAPPNATFPAAPPNATFPAAPPNATFPAAAYEACLTDDQARAVRAFESLATPGNAVVTEADRGRGKSSAAGIAAGALALAGADVLVTAPAFRNAAEAFARAQELLSAHSGDAGSDGSDPEANADGRTSDPEANADGRTLDAPGGGRVRYLSPVEAAELPDDPDVVLVDEAAALPVRLLERFLDESLSVAFCTTVHGYEGAGRGFAIRFRERLLASRFVVRDVRLDEPIRYARNDPVESWAARALLLDARPAVDEAVAGSTVENATYRALSPSELLADETLLGEAFGLLVAAHYRTEPNDLARLLDAPNLSARALVAADRVVAVALLAREGRLDAETRRRMYEGERVRGNMVPDVLTSQLRDEGAAEPQGLRTVRIATHHAVRDEGFGSRLLDEVHAEFEGEADYFSVGYGATPRLLRFWRRAGYRTVHLSTSQNDASGEHSAIMLRPATESGRDLCSRHAISFRDRERDGLSDAHRDVDPDVVIGALRACSASAPVDLAEVEWRSVVGASFGPGMYDSAPGAFRDLALAALIGGEESSDGAHGDETNNDDASREDARGDETSLDDRERRLLVRKVLQGRPWESVADELGYVSTAACMRALGNAYEPLVEEFGTAFALAERDRFTRE